MPVSRIHLLSSGLLHCPSQAADEAEFGAIGAAAAFGAIAAEPPSQQQPPPQQPQQQSLGRLPLEPPSQLPQLQQPQPQQPQPQQSRSFCTYFRYVTPSLPLPEPAAWRQPFALFLSAHAELKSLADGVGVGAYAYVGKAYVHWVTKGKHTEAELVAKVWSELQAKDRMFCEQACKKCYKKSRK